MGPGTEEDTQGKEEKPRGSSTTEGTLGSESKGLGPDGLMATRKNWVTLDSRIVRPWGAAAWPAGPRTALRGEHARPGTRGILPAGTGKDQGSGRRQDCPTHASIALSRRESRPSSGTSFRVPCESRWGKRANPGGVTTGWKASGLRPHFGQATTVCAQKSSEATLIAPALPGGLFA
jgi:hypothetical protein